MEKIPCWVYRSSVKDGRYLYMPKADAFENVPERLMKSFGKPVPVMSLLLTPQKKLAKEDVKLVMENLKEKGFHLQIDDIKPIDASIALNANKF